MKESAWRPWFLNPSNRTVIHLSGLPTPISSLVVIGNVVGFLVKRTWWRVALRENAVPSRATRDEIDAFLKQERANRYLLIGRIDRSDELFYLKLIITRPGSPKSFSSEAAGRLTPFYAKNTIFPTLAGTFLNNEFLFLAVPGRLRISSLKPRPTLINPRIFTGVDQPTAIGVAKDLVVIASEQGEITALDFRPTSVQFLLSLADESPSEEPETLKQEVV